MEDMTKYIGQKVKVWDYDSTKASRTLLAVLPEFIKYRYITNFAGVEDNIQSWLHCIPIPIKLEWYENPENYGKAVKVKVHKYSEYEITRLDETSSGMGLYSLQELEESDWKMV